MQDVKIEPNSQGIFDIVIDNELIDSVDGFETTINTALFTDARAPEQLVQNAENRRGWIGDILTAIDNRKTGSNLWLLDQARLTTRTISQAEIYTKDALSFFIEDSLASDIDINIERGQKSFDINIEYKIANNIIERYNALWRVTGAS